jgi:uncharacterized protein
VQITLDQSGGALLVRRYDADSVWIGEQRCARPLLLSRQQLIDQWPAESLATLTLAQLEPVFASRAALVIVGTRAADRIPPVEIRRAFRERNIALEAMEFGAACRTYNVLVQEEREVLAALFP